eukprot:c27557_g1_i1 orf=1-198(-)
MDCGFSKNHGLVHYNVVSSSTTGMLPKLLMIPTYDTFTKTFHKAHDHDDHNEWDEFRKFSNMTISA